MDGFVLIIVVVVIGAVIGWLSSFVVGGTGFGLQGDVITGVIGAFIGNYLLPAIGLIKASNMALESVNAAIGAVVAVGVAKLVKRFQGG
jgi:uncharacterized membrane protein YeaQ/YmgE (transglycosylase-associated protein family)